MGDVEQALSTVGATPRIAVETAHREAIVPLVLAGGGATLLPASLARDAHARGAQIRPTDPPIRRRTGLIHRPGPLSPRPGLPAPRHERTAARPRETSAPVSPDPSTRPRTTILPPHTYRAWTSPTHAPIPTT